MTPDEPGIVVSAAVAARFLSVDVLPVRVMSVLVFDLLMEDADRVAGDALGDASPEPLLAFTP